LSEAAEKRGIPVKEERIAIASSAGIESPLAAFPTSGHAADLTIFNTMAVIGSTRQIAKKIVIVREWLEPTSPRHRMLAARHRFGADAMVGVSTEVVGQWRKCIRGPARQFVVPNWLARSVLDKTADSPGGENRSGILCIGRFNRWKGQEALADAYEQAFSARPDRPPLRFVGSQPGTDFDVRAQALAERGSRLGWEVAPFTADPSDHFRSASVVVVPSLQPEPFGTVILEAIGHGCRVIAFDGGGPSDLAKAFPGIVELVPRDRLALGSALAKWWDEGGQALSEAEMLRARHTLESRYSPEAGAASWRMIVDALAA
jgi:glycosyltransferase involved in cell wall biosynthesis